MLTVSLLCRASCSRDALYSVVSDVGRYKDFVPWCVGSRVLRQHSRSCEAELTVGFKMITESYTSRVTMVPGRHVRAVASDTSMFRHLVNEWEFEDGPHPNSCWVNFFVEFQFRNSLYSSVSGMFMDEVVHRMVRAFESRAQRLAREEAAPAAAAALGASPGSDGRRPAPNPAYVPHFSDTGAPSPTLARMPPSEVAKAHAMFDGRATGARPDGTPVMTLDDYTVVAASLQAEVKRALEQRLRGPGARPAAAQSRPPTPHSVLPALACLLSSPPLCLRPLQTVRRCSPRYRASPCTPWRRRTCNSCGWRLWWRRECWAPWKCARRTRLTWPRCAGVPRGRLNPRPPHACLPRPHWAHRLLACPGPGYEQYQFRAMDRERRGALTFEEFASGLAVMLRGPAEERARFAFRCCDQDGDGYVTLRELRAFGRALARSQWRAVRDLQTLAQTARSDAAAASHRILGSSSYAVREAVAKFLTRVARRALPTEGGEEGGPELPPAASTEDALVSVVEEVVEGVMHSADGDGDGRVTYEEFRGSVLCRNDVERLGLLSPTFLDRA